MRECGDCSLCCTLLGVVELGKGANVSCQHNKAGCSIYDDRPESCREFSCLWLQGQLPAEMKPSLCHVVVGGTRDGAGITLYVDPAFPDAHEAPLVDGMIQDAKNKLPVVIAIGARKAVRFMEVTLQ